MSMQLKIVHTTTFTYDGPAVASYNEARLTPQSSPAQLVIHSRLDVTPTPWSSSYTDYFGTAVTAFEVLDPHQDMTVSATSTVQVQRAPHGEPVLDWSDLAEPEVADRWTEYLSISPRVQPPLDLATRVREIAARSARPGDAAREVCALVNAEVEYRTGSTHVKTLASDAWAIRAGVCQDMAHLALGGLRTLGIPARYVSGYLHPKRDPKVGDTVVGESHAWVEWWDDGWRAYDPTNDHEPQDRYVVVATGRDYVDVKPLTGIYSGAGTERMQVDVQVTRMT